MRLKTIVIALMYVHYIRGQGFIQNNIGNLQFTQQEWQFQQILNISEYKHNAQLLEQCKDTLESFCEKSQNPLCIHFLRMARDVNLNVNTDLEKLNTLIRSKRMEPCTIFALIGLGITIVGLIGEYFVFKSALEDVKNEFNEQLNLFEKSNKASLNMAEIIDMMGKDTNKALNIIRDHYNNETKSFDENTAL